MVVVGVVGSEGDWVDMCVGQRDTLPCSILPFRRLTTSSLTSRIVQVRGHHRRDLWRRLGHSREVPPGRCIVVRRLNWTRTGFQRNEVLGGVQGVDKEGGISQPPTTRPQATTKEPPRTTH